jgi:hypothetical protein
MWAASVILTKLPKANNNTLGDIGRKFAQSGHPGPNPHFLPQPQICSSAFLAGLPDGLVSKPKNPNLDKLW